MRISFDLSFHSLIGIREANALFHKGADLKDWDENKKPIFSLPTDGELMAMKFDILNDKKMDNKMYMEQQYDNGSLNIKITLKRELWIKIGDDKPGQINMIMDKPGNMSMSDIEVVDIERGSISIDEDKYIRWQFVEKFELETLCLELKLNGVEENEYVKWKENGVKVTLMHHYTTGHVRVQACGIYDCVYSKHYPTKWVHYVKPNDLYTFHFV